MIPVSMARNFVWARGFGRRWLQLEEPALVTTALQEYHCSDAYVTETYN